MLCPYFGPFPEWMDKFLADFKETMCPQGYDMLLDTDLEGFKKRVITKIGITFPGVWGSPKVWDYRCALGLLYEEELKDYDYWGHVDFDMVFGDMNKYVPDELLDQLDVYSSHHEYVCGCFSLYRNAPEVNKLFMDCSMFEIRMRDPEPSGWVEQEFSRTLEKSGLKYLYTFNQGNPWTKEPILVKKGGRLNQLIDTTWHEIMFFHFRHSKRWPL